MGLAFLLNAKAFSVGSKQLTRGIHRPQASRVDDEDKRPSWIDLPRARSGDAPQLSGVEITTGRVAMMGFCGLLAVEIISGESFGQQILDAASVLSGVH
jgi:hypothetical protein